MIDRQISDVISDAHTSRRIKIIYLYIFALLSNAVGLTLLHSEQPKLYRVLAVLSAIGLILTTQ